MPVTRGFDVFFDLRLIKRLSKQSRGWWFEMLSRPLWRHCNECILIENIIISAPCRVDCYILNIHCCTFLKYYYHCCDVIMGTMASQITNLTIVSSTVYSVADQRKHRSSASLAIVRGIHRGPVNSPHKWPVTGKMFPFDDIIMVICSGCVTYYNLCSLSHYDKLFICVYPYHIYRGLAIV